MKTIIYRWTSKTSIDVITFYKEGNSSYVEMFSRVKADVGVDETKYFHAKVSKEQGNSLYRAKRMAGYKRVKVSA